MTGMTSDLSIKRRVGRLENETESIYELITEIRSTQLEHTQRFEQIDGRFEQIDARFEQIDARFEQIDTRFEQIDTRFEQIDARFEQIDAGLAEIVRRLPEPS